MSPTRIQEHCASKGRDIAFHPGKGLTLFDADHGIFTHVFEYRDVACKVTIPFKGEPPKKFWAKLLRYVRDEKKYQDKLWEEGADVYALRS